MTPPAPTRILAVRLQGLGDVLMTTPALRAARQRWPAAHISMLVGRAAAPAVAANPHLDEVVSIDERLFFGPRPLALWRLARRLRKQGFDLGLVFSRSRGLRSWLALAGVRRLATLPRRLVAPGEAGSWDEARYEVLTNLSVLDGADGHSMEMEFPISASAHTRAQALLAPGDGRGFLVLAPGGGENAAWRMPQKRWPAARFAQLADAARGCWGLPSVVVGGPDDRPLAREIDALARHRVLDASMESLEVTAALIARATLLASNDSVAMHLGVITGTPLVALFGPTNPRTVLPAHGRFRVVRPSIAVQPVLLQGEAARSRPSAGRGAFRACPHHHSSCWRRSAGAEVVEAAQSLLGGGLAAAAGQAAGSPPSRPPTQRFRRASHLQRGSQPGPGRPLCCCGGGGVGAVLRGDRRNDGSRDQTPDRLAALQAELGERLRVVRHQSNRGYGAALRSGFQASRGDLVFYTDSDNQFDVTELREILPLMRDHDAVLGYRLDRQDTWLRRRSSGVFNVLSRSALGVSVRDVDCSFKLFRGPLLRALALGSEDFFIDLEMVTRMQRGGWRIVQHGVRHYPRRAGPLDGAPHGRAPHSLVHGSPVAALAAGDRGRATVRAPCLPREERSAVIADPDAAGPRTSAAPCARR